MVISDALKLALAVNLFWVLVALFLNHKWYNYCSKLNDEWSEICENMCSEIEEYYTKGEEENNEQSAR